MATGQSSCALCWKHMQGRIQGKLSCQHVFCQDCLNQRVKYGRIVCPTCGAVTPVPENDVTKQSNNFYMEPKQVHMCNVCEKTKPTSICTHCPQLLLLCHECMENHNKISQFEGHSVKAYCTDHCKVAVHICIKCEKAACVVCIMNIHNTHQDQIKEYDEGICHIKEEIAKKATEANKIIDSQRKKEEQNETEIKIIESIKAKYEAKKSKYYTKYIKYENSLKEIGNKYAKNINDSRSSFDFDETPRLQRGITEYKNINDMNKLFDLDRQMGRDLQSLMNRRPFLCTTISRSVLEIDSDEDSCSAVKLSDRIRAKEHSSVSKSWNTMPPDRSCNGMQPTLKTSQYIPKLSLFQKDTNVVDFAKPIRQQERKYNPTFIGQQRNKTFRGEYNPGRQQSSVLNHPRANSVAGQADPLLIRNKDSDACSSNLSMHIGRDLSPRKQPSCFQHRRNLPPLQPERPVSPLRTRSSLPHFSFERL